MYSMVVNLRISNIFQVFYALKILWMLNIPVFVIFYITVLQYALQTSILLWSQNP